MIKIFIDNDNFSNYHYISSIIIIFADKIISLSFAFFYQFGSSALIWSMKDIANDIFVSKEIRNLNENLIGNEFIYNSDNVLAATKKQLALQNTIRK